jgi:hypothetical protein
MHYVLLAEHDADVCPTSNATTRELLLQTGQEIAGIAQRNGVNLVSGPWLNREHVVVVVVEADRSEAVDRFIVESRLMQWNRIRILPSLGVEEGMKDVQESKPLF